MTEAVTTEKSRGSELKFRVLNRGKKIGTFWKNLTNGDRS